MERKDSMEFTSQYQLYQRLIPAFNVKHRLLKYNNTLSITNEDMWNYLIENKWKKSYGLTLSEMVNDIISLDVSKIEGDK